MDLAEALAIGTRHHQAGQLAEAERIYRQILQADPRNPHALHQLGMLALQGRAHDAAVELIARAIQVEPRQASFYANLAEAYRHAGKPSEAIASLEKAIALQPTLAPAHVKLGMLLADQRQLNPAAEAYRAALKLRPEDQATRTLLGHVLQDMHKLSEAEACFRRVQRSEPDSAGAHLNLGTVLQEQGQAAEAEACFRRALELKPDYAEAHANLGILLQSAERYDEAAAHYAEAIRLKPDAAGAHHNWGTLCELQGDLEAAVGRFREAVRINPGLLEAKCALGLALERLGQPGQALVCYQEVIAQKPDYAPGHAHLGGLLRTQGRLEDAIAACREAIHLDPTVAETYNNLGVALNETGARDEALASFRRAIELKGDFSVAHSNLGVTLQALGRLDEAIAANRRAIELEPENAGQHGNLLYLLNYHPDFDRDMLFREHRAWGQKHADPLTARSRPHENDRSAARRLKLGYVSGHFAAHAVNFFSEPILAHHDHAQFEVFCYSNLAGGDETTKRLRGYADQWREIVRMSDEEVAEQIRRDQIDILVDLSGHIGGHRLLVFARKPAPVQVTYIGYQNTTGMLAMDYRLTDDYSDPPGTTDAFYTERLVRLPRSFFCYLPSSDAPAIIASPAAANGYVTFGSFNNFAKVTPQVLATWAQILKSTPRARLVILADMAPSLVEYLHATFEAHGVERGRLELVHRLPREKYLELINRVDVALDPFPFNGHTTTCDALWQGVPVITLSGDSYVTRFGGSALKTLGFENLIAHTPEEYVKIGVELAGDPPRLAELRGGLRKRMASSPLLDFETFTRNLEREYRQMWARWCASVSA